MKKTTAAAGMVGEILEWYDFTLYGFMAPIIATLFFPLHNMVLSLLATFGGFAAGYFMRPIGGLLFGHFGDRYGRKKVLAATLICMAVPTFLMGLLPTYATIGLWAPILLIFLRMLQGVSCGGEYTGSIIFLYENSSSSRQGFFSSLAIMGSFIGALFSIAAIGLVSTKFTHTALLAWGWRIPFLLGIVTSAIGFYIRLKVSDTPVFEALKKQGKLVRVPFKEVFKSHKKKLLTVLGVNVQVAVLSYIVIMAMPTYLTQILGLPMDKVMFLNLVTILTIILMIPVAGWLTDALGNKFLLMVSTVFTLIVSYPIYLLFMYKEPHLILIGEIIFGILIATTMVSSAKTMARTAPANVRYSCVSIGHGLCDSIFGGTAPLMAMILISKMGATAPAYYIMFAGMITLMVVLKLVGSSQSAEDSASPELIMR